MDGHLLKKIKRKDLDEVNDEFSDFSLSSPARKIRRLDAELPPIIEEEAAEIALDLEQPDPEIRISSCVEGKSGRSVIEEGPSVWPNKEMAIVLFKPVDSLRNSPSNLSIDPGFISSIKNLAVWQAQSNRAIVDEAEENKNGAEKNECLAVIPWVPSRNPWQGPESEAYQMDAEAMEAASMEIDDDVASVRVGQENEFNSVSSIEGHHHLWQQQHCMIPPIPPQNTSSPILSYR
ncbi:hypothetical protein Nepgr_015458 [Nepenthes gracilis]|uniref:Uncharacterized protein n=1 Tax=Nepenthes gracilis TaxID=150966 RepID=A0AAD3XQE4_NEPGR|nr:hypothetical protein Nepgr_015458 [Nepenthes gracilis]